MSEIYCYCAFYRQDLQRPRWRTVVEKWKHSLSESVCYSVQVCIGQKLSECHFPLVPVQMHSDPLRFVFGSEHASCLSWAQRVVTSFTVAHAAHCIAEGILLSWSGLFNHTQFPDITFPNLHVPAVRPRVKALAAQDTCHTVESLRIIRKQ